MGKNDGDEFGKLLLGVTAYSALAEGNEAVFTELIQASNDVKLASEE